VRGGRQQRRRPPGLGRVPQRRGLAATPYRVVTGPWKHLVFGHPARPDGVVDRGAYIFCVLEQFCRHLKHREIYADASTRYRNLQARLLDGAEWEAVKDDVLTTLRPRTRMRCWPPTSPIWTRR
jgi:hypothetical protein